MIFAYLSKLTSINRNLFPPPYFRRWIVDIASNLLMTCLIQIKFIEHNRKFMAEILSGWILKKSSIFTWILAVIWIIYQLNVQKSNRGLKSSGYLASKSNTDLVKIEFPWHQIIQAFVSSVTPSFIKNFTRIKFTLNHPNPIQIRNLNSNKNEKTFQI